MRKAIATSVAAALLSASFCVSAADDTALQELDARIRTLEVEGQKLREQAAAALAAADAAHAELEKLKASMQDARQAQATAAVAAPRETSAPNPGGANGNAFNPAIAVILNGDYAHHSLNPDSYVHAGFPNAAGSGP